jgi:deoxyribodipyrimidine photo-lyase
MHDLALSKQCAHFSRELGWREFSYYLLYHFPELPEKNFKEKFDTFAWSPNKKLLSCWQKGRTGYPLVDAGMRQLWQTGYMHNRIRMITASFLTKNLLIDWREGAKWFWHTLLDADLASNSMNWQWVAGSGADAAPYFRIFNPITQSKKFDPAGEYIRHWIPELNKLPDKYIHQPMEAPPNILKSAGIILGINYPFPIIDHTVTRQKALSVYRKLKGKKPGTHQVYIAS